VYRLTFMRYDLWHLFGPLSWPIWLWLLALLARWRHRPVLSTRLWASGGLWGTLILALPLGHIIIRPLETRYPVPTPPADISGILMLTGAERLTLSAENGQPVLNEAGERVVAARMLFQKYPTSTLVVIGGVREKGLQDTEVARQILMGTGVPARQLKLVSGTVDTCTNAQAAKTIMTEGQTWLLVTSAAHMPRAMACFQKHGLKPVPYPVDFRGRKDIWRPLFSPGTLSNLTAFDLASHEWIGLVWYRLSGRTDRMMPAK
jgi:uncharacterized SAM-binding protein YcdF (DUF218 family)